MKRLVESLLLLSALLFGSCGKKETIVFLGDSITQEGNSPGGYVDIIRTRLCASDSSSWSVIGAGISGNKVPDLQARLDHDVLSQHPTLVVIYIGINDVWHYALGIGGTPPDQYEAGLRDLIRRISSSGASVLLCTPTVIGEKFDGTNPLDPRLDEYAAISRTVAESTGTELCDLRSLFLTRLRELNPDNASQDILTRDGVHLNAAGNLFVAEQILAYLAEKF